MKSFKHRGERLELLVNVNTEGRKCQVTGDSNWIRDMQMKKFMSN